MHIKKTEWWQRLTALGVKDVIPTPEAEAQMSAVLLDLADPLVEEDSTNVEYVETVILLTILAWNKAMSPADEQNAIEKQIIDSLVPPDGDAQLVAEIIEAMDLVEERRKQHFPDLRRVVCNYELRVSGRRIALNVASAPLATR